MISFFGNLPDLQAKVVDKASRFCSLTFTVHSVSNEKHLGLQFQLAMWAVVQNEADLKAWVSAGKLRTDCLLVSNWVRESSEIVYIGGKWGKTLGKLLRLLATFLLISNVYYPTVWRSNPFSHLTLHLSRIIEFYVDQVCKNKNWKTKSPVKTKSMYAFIVLVPEPSWRPYW